MIIYLLKWCLFFSVLGIAAMIAFWIFSGGLHQIYDFDNNCFRNENRKK